jgi:MOSC domain-containing protein YiiM
MGCATHSADCGGADVARSVNFYTNIRLGGALFHLSVPGAAILRVHSRFRLKARNRMTEQGRPTRYQPASRGYVDAIYIAEAAGVEMHALTEALLIVGVGIKGDRYATGHGHYSQLWHPDRQLTLIEQEVIDEVAVAIGKPVNGSELRRNIVTKEMRLNELVGATCSIGDVVIHVGRLNVPCRYLERLIDKQVFQPLLGRSGLNCQILRGGVIRPGDPIRVLSASEIAAMRPCW